MHHKQLAAKERILKAADTLFHQQGYTLTGINQIIKEANVAKASLYYHFKTKDDLCIAYLQKRHEEWNLTFLDYVKDKSDKINAAFDFLIKNNEENNYRGCSFLNMLSETSPDKTKIFLELQKHKLELLFFFTNHIPDNEIAYTVYSLFENAIIESQLFRNQEPVVRLKKIAISLVHKKIC